MISSTITFKAHDQHCNLVVETTDFALGEKYLHLVFNTIIDTKLINVGDRIKTDGIILYWNPVDNSEFIEIGKAFPYSPIHPKPDTEDIPF